MPKLWTDSIEAHRDSVTDAIFAATAGIIAHEGFTRISMARIAQEAGIGRATLYKYFSNVDDLLVSWHERTVSHHLRALSEVAHATIDPGETLKAVLTVFAEQRVTAKYQHAPAAMLHAQPHMQAAEDELQALMKKVISAAAKAGAIRRDVPVDDLARFSVSALQGLEGATHATAKRTVALVVAALKSSP